MSAHDPRAQDLAEALRDLLDAPASGGLRADADARDRAERLLDSLTYDTAGSASRQNYIDTGVYFLTAAEIDPERLEALIACRRADDGIVDEDEDDAPELEDPCRICGEEEAVDYGMCASCEHNARRSGWNPGDPE